MAFWLCVLVIKKTFLSQNYKNNFSIMYSSTFTVLLFMFKMLMHLQYIFVGFYFFFWMNFLFSHNHLLNKPVFFHLPTVLKSHVCHSLSNGSFSSLSTPGVTNYSLYGKFGLLPVFASKFHWNIAIPVYIHVVSGCLLKEQSRIELMTYKV